MNREELLRKFMAKMGYSSCDIEARLKDIRQRPDAALLNDVVSADEVEKTMHWADCLAAPGVTSRDPKQIMAGMRHAAQELRARLGERPARETSMGAREYYFKLGMPMWKETYALKPDASPNDVVMLATDRHRRVFANDPQALEQAMLLLSTEEGQSVLLQSTTWVNCAMPVVQLAGHKYAAALAATAVPRDIDIKPPWPAFLLELPSGVFSTEENGSSHPITHAMVHVVDKKYTGSRQCDVWNFNLFSPDMVNLRRWGWSLDDLRDKDVCDDADGVSLSAFTVAIDDADQRTLTLATRIILNTCLFMSDPSEVKPIGKSHGSPRHPGRDSNGPMCRVYRVGKPIDLDVRPAVAEYLAGRKGSSPTVQHLRRGHFTHQPYGPGSSLRRVQWRQPCWVGPDDALINVRPHVMPTAPANKGALMIDGRTEG